MIRIRIVVYVLTLFLAQAGSVIADEPVAGLDKSAAMRVRDAWRILPESNIGRKDEVWLGEAIRVRVENLDLFRQTLCKEGTDGQGGGKEKDISLFLNRMEIKGVRPRLIDGKKSELEFLLLRREALPAYLDDRQQKLVWATLFGFQDRLTMKPRKVEVSVGPEDGEPLESGAVLQLVRIHLDGWAYLYLVLIAIMGMTYIYAGKRGAFSDRGLAEDDTARQTLSLARVQMGFWFFQVVAAFLFIWMVIGELPEIPASILGLIGIASGTALGSAVIDCNKQESARRRLIEQTEQQHEGEESIPLAREIHRINAKLKELEKKADASKNKVDGVHRNRYTEKARTWLSDLLTDVNGISFHRLQMAIWTLVLGVVFIQQVLSNLALPDFDATLLALMGISSGTYLGFKLPEQRS